MMMILLPTPTTKQQKRTKIQHTTPIYIYINYTYFSRGRKLSLLSSALITTYGERERELKEGNTHTHNKSALLFLQRWCGMGNSLGNNESKRDTLLLLLEERNLKEEKKKNQMETTINTIFFGLTFSLLRVLVAYNILLYILLSVYNQNQGNLYLHVVCVRNATSCTPTTFGLMILYIFRSIFILVGISLSF